MPVSPLWGGGCQKGVWEYAEPEGESRGTEAPLGEGQSQHTGLARSPFLSEGQQCAHTFH